MEFLTVKELSTFASFKNLEGRSKPRNKEELIYFIKVRGYQYEDIKPYLEGLTGKKYLSAELYRLSLEVEIEDDDIVKSMSKISLQGKAPIKRKKRRTPYTRPKPLTLSEEFKRMSM